MLWYASSIWSDAGECFWKWERISIHAFMWHMLKSFHKFAIVFLGRRIHLYRLCYVSRRWWMFLKMRKNWICDTWESICTSSRLYFFRKENTFVWVVWCEQRAVRRQVSVPAPPLKRPSCQTGALDYHHLQANM